MKVIFVFHDSERNNGANHSMMDVIDYISIHNGVEPLLIFPKLKGSAIDYATKQGYQVYTCRYGRWDFPNSFKGLKKTQYFIKWFVKLILTVPTYYTLKKLIRENDTKLIYTNTYAVFLGAWLNKKTGIPHIWHIREFGKEDHNFKLIFGDKVLYKYLNDYTNRIVFISQSISAKYLPYISEKDKCFVLYNDIAEPLCNRKARWSDTETIRILIAGTLQEGKGQLEAIKAVKLLKETYALTRFKLYIAGTPKGEYFQKLNDYVLDNNLIQYVEFCGYVSEMTALREKMHIGVVASSSEAFGRVTVEGMLSGMLMIGADAAGTSELITDGLNGYLYPLHKHEKLAEILFQSCMNIPKTREVATTGCKMASEKFAQYRTSEAIGKIINKLCKK
ncbi:glycosyltransferase family 4 protein [Lacrimispora celerecrescens]|uniref:Glycosyl transferase family 1 domain-containing protein n=1 Tax=Lacrimispora celerecrescens TaxID=29354 RepID=A0A084JQG7_9FIRM|nr:glycosyltransferase family 4 protein [Lacrimispora celerecrescens]KEZ91201.1 hypothetical protein IO98_03890 [Lacrimispora celerecrescens]